VFPVWEGMTVKMYSHIDAFDQTQVVLLCSFGELSKQSPVSQQASRGLHVYTIPGVHTGSVFAGAALRILDRHRIL
jgi:hypothetical protein